MNKLASTLALAILALVVLAAAYRPVVALVNALTGPIVTCGITACIVRAVWWYTR